MKLLGSDDILKTLADKRSNELALASKLGQILQGCPEIFAAIQAACGLALTKLGGLKDLSALSEADAAELASIPSPPADLAACSRALSLFARFAAALTPEQRTSAASILAGWSSAREQFRSPWQDQPESPTATCHAVGTTLRTLEQLFGLPAGVDVAGSSAELVFALEWLLDQGKGHPRVCMLFPLTDLVASGRYTILELAVTLTMNAYSTYAVGFYSSLYPVDDGEPRAVPDGFDKQRLERAKRDIESALESAEIARLMALIFEARDASPRGLVCETEVERQQLRKFASLTPTRYHYFAVPRPIVAGLRDQARLNGGIIKQIVADMTRGPEAWEEELDVFEAL
ncbi:hypothetical protein ACNOYE_30955 [Nannocystaceae bacterium ST9]